MDEKNKGARRRRAFADFKENQYDDSFSLSSSKKRNKTAKKVFKIILIIILTAAFIILGFCFTDSLMNISEEPYEDSSTYTPVFINTTTKKTTTTTSEESSTTEVYNQNQWAGNY